MLNIKLNGNLGKDPEFRTTNDGTDYAVLYVASDHPGSDKTDWYNVGVFNAKAIEAVREMGTGDPVKIVGTGRMNEWTDTAGDTRKQINLTASSVQRAESTKAPAGQDRTLEQTQSAESMSAGR